VTKELSEEESALSQKITEVKKKKGGLDPAIIVCRDKNQPIQIILRAIKPPLVVGDYVSISVSDSDFLNIMRVFQQIQESGVSMIRSFECREGVRSFSEMEYYNFLEIIERFIQDIYGVEKFFRQKLDSRFKAIGPLKSIHTLVFTKWQQDPSVLERGPHTSVFPLIDNIKWFSLEEFEQQVLPLIEAAFFWETNKQLDLTTLEFRDTIAKRIRGGDQSALYGYLSEVYMSGLYIFSEWKDVRYIDKLNGSTFERYGDWVFMRDDKENLGIECKDKRQAIYGRNQVRLVDIEDLVNSAIAKFSADKSHKKRMLWVNVTNIRDYSRPSLVDLGNIHWRESRDDLAGILTPSFALCNKDGEIDCIVLAWREKVESGNAFEYIQRYVVTEDADCAACLPQVQPAIHVSPGKHFFIRTYVFPEPSLVKWGPEETAPQTPNE
jgi:hypothetical protein